MTLNQFNLTEQGQTKANELLASELQKKTTSPLTRYGYAGIIRRAAENAQQQNTHDGIREAMALYPEAVQAGKHFTHEGCEYSIQRTPLYDFTQQKAWQRRAAAVANLEDKLKLAKTQLKNVELELVQKGTVTAYDYRIALRSHVK